MDVTRFCQSCGLILTSTDLSGKEKDGSLSLDYCKYCYDNGAFINPKMTLSDMRARVIKMLKMGHASTDTIELAVERLPHLKRWKMKKRPIKKEVIGIDDETLREKHPLEKAPSPAHLVQSEDELDLLLDEDLKEMPGTEPPPPGEGP